MMNCLIFDCAPVGMPNKHQKGKISLGLLSGLEVPAEFPALLLLPSNFHDKGARPDLKPPAKLLVRVSKSTKEFIKGVPKDKRQKAIDILNSMGDHFIDAKLLKGK